MRTSAVMPSHRSSLGRLLLLLLLLITLGCDPATCLVVRSVENGTVVLPSCHNYREGESSSVRVRWWRGEELLADSTSGDPGDSRTRLRSNRSLELTRLRVEDGGDYRCQASETRPSYGDVAQQTHQLQVVQPASARAVPESGRVEVSLGEEAALVCETGGLPEPKVSWRFEGEELQPLKAGNHFGRRLLVKASNSSLAGVYSCHVDNGVGEPASATLELRIKHEPRVEPLAQWLHTAPGLRARLACLVGAWPEATVEWSLDGRPVERSQRLSRYKQDEPAARGTTAAIPLQRHTLVIREVRVNDLGSYSCRATNELGSAEAVIELSGLPKAPLLKLARFRATGSEDGAGSSGCCNFIWEVDSYSPIVEYQFWFRQVRGSGEKATPSYYSARTLDSREDWKRLFIPSGSDNEAVGPLYASSYNLAGLRPSERGYEALVLARNKFGWSSPSRLVTFASSREALTEELAAEEDAPAAVQVTLSSSSTSGGGARDAWNATMLVLLLTAAALRRSGMMLGMML